MAYEFKLPDIGEGVVEGEIVKWLVGPGEAVSEDQPLVEIMTDKASVEIPSPRAGKVVSLEGDEGDVVSVGQTLLIIEEGKGASEESSGDEDEDEESSEEKSKKSKKSSRDDSGKKDAKKSKKSKKSSRDDSGKKNEDEDDDEKAKAATHKAPPRDDSEGSPTRLEAGLPARSSSPLAGRIEPVRRASSSGGKQALASPAVRRQARRMGVDLEELQGSASGGRVTAADLEKGGTESKSEASASGPTGLPPGVEPPPEGGERRIPLKGVRRAIAKAMQTSKNTAAHFTFVEEVDMRALVHMRESLKPAAAERGAKLTYLPFFVKAATVALKRHPQLNCTLDAEADEIVYRGYYNIGVAAATEKGLMVPVVKGADALSLVEIAQEIERLAEAARSGKAKLDDLQGSTFTITSLGAQGGLFATPVINFPEVAIMGIHQIKDRPIIDNGQIVPGKVMLLSLSFDHRLVDGHIGAAFCYEVVELLEHPERLFVDAI